MDNIIIDSTKAIGLSKSAVFEITKQCNCFCKHCFTNAGNKLKFEMNAQQIIRAIDELITANINFITISGGEPTIRSDLICVLEKIKRRSDTVIGLFTNGFNISDANINILKNRIDQFVVSIDGQKNNHDSLRGTGTYDKVIELLTLFSENDVIFSIQMMVSDYSFQDLSHIVELGIKYNASGLKFSHIGPQGRALTNSDIFISINRKLELLELIKVLQTQIEVPIEHNFILKEDFINKKDQFLKIFLHIEPDGSVFPYYGMNEYTLFNCTESNSFNLQSIFDNFIDSKNSIRAYYNILSDVYDECLQNVRHDDVIIPYEELLIERMIMNLG